MSLFVVVSASDKAISRRASARPPTRESSENTLRGARCGAVGCDVGRNVGAYRKRGGDIGDVLGVDRHEIASSGECRKGAWNANNVQAHILYLVATLLFGFRHAIYGTDRRCSAGGNPADKPDRGRRFKTDS